MLTSGLEIITVKSLAQTPAKIIYQAFKSAFSDYSESFDITQEQFMYMLERRGYTAGLSFGAFIGDTLVGFTLNGVAQWNKKLTAYDTGTGVITGFRNHGIARRIFNESLPALREKNISQYLLEVIKTNIAAFNLYKKAGFRITREFNYYIAVKQTLKFPKPFVQDYNIRVIKEPDWDHLSSFWDFYPSWQNSIAALKRKKEHIAILGIWQKDHLAGYAAFEKHSGDIPQIAIEKAHRRKGLATTLLQFVVSKLESERISIINTKADYQPFIDFAASINLIPGAGQYEMLLDIQVE